MLLACVGLPGRRREEGQHRLEGPPMVWTPLAWCWAEIQQLALNSTLAIQNKHVRLYFWFCARPSLRPDRAVFLAVRPCVFKTAPDRIARG